MHGKFALPKSDYERIAKLKMVAKRVGLKARKNELFRLGLRAVQQLRPAELRDALMDLRLPK